MNSSGLATAAASSAEPPRANRMTPVYSSVVANIAVLTHAPYTAVRLLLCWNVPHTMRHMTIRIALAPLMKIWCSYSALVCFTCMNGKRPSCAAWLRMVNTPVMSAWLPTTLASVAIARMPLYCADAGLVPPATHQKTLPMTALGPLAPVCSPMKPSLVQALLVGDGNER